MIQALALKSLSIKSLAYGLVGGGAVQAVGDSTGSNSSLTYGLYPLIGVLGVALITAFVNLKISSRNSGVDMKEHRRLQREVKAQAKIIEALTEKKGEESEQKTKVG